MFVKPQRLFANLLKKQIYAYSTMIHLDEQSVVEKCRGLAPPLTHSLHKGQAGRIGVIGGCLEYTGAPYYAAISCLKVGADLVHIFCMKEAATVIKSYSPELIVHPYLDDENAITKIEPWLERLHTLVIGPGLGRDDSTFRVLGEIIKMARNLKKPLIIDADGLFFVSTNIQIIKDYPVDIVLTPNANEYINLVKPKPEAKESKFQQIAPLFQLCPNLTLVCKGPQDDIFNSSSGISVTKGGSGRRSGGQGDILSGSLGIFLAWALQKTYSPDDGLNRGIFAAYSACKLVRKCNEQAFKKFGRSMTALDMVSEIHSVFEENFEIKS